MLTAERPEPAGLGARAEEAVEGETTGIGATPFAAFTPPGGDARALKFKDGLPDTWRDILRSCAVSVTGFTDLSPAPAAGSQHVGLRRESGVVDANGFEHRSEVLRASRKEGKERKKTKNCHGLPVRYLPHTGV
jgi:hypothetical protein